MVLPLLFGLAGSALGGAGALSSIPLIGGLGAVGAGALGSGLGRFIETGDLGKGIETGLTSFVGGKALGALGKGLNIDALDPSKIPTGVPDGGTALKTGLETLKNPNVLGQAAIGQASAMSPPELPPVAPVEFENRQAGVPDRITRRPPKGYRPGFDGEFDYGVSPNYGVGLMSQNDPRYMGSKTQDAGISQLQRVAMDNPELMYSGMPPMFRNMGGLVGLLQNEKVKDNLSNMVGITLNPAVQREINNAMTGEYTPEGYAPLTMADAGFSGGGELKPIPEGNKGLPNLPKDVRNEMGFMQEGGAVEGGMEANMVIDEAVKAIQGVSDTPEVALGAFVAKYGEEALEDLIDRVTKGEMDEREDNMIEGEGDGMDDKVPATLEGQQDVMLSDGEFVVPADVVSGIGNGSSDAGAKELEEMMTRVRQLRTGKTEQPEQVPQGMMLPV